MTCKLQRRSVLFLQCPSLAEPWLFLYPLTTAVGMQMRGATVVCAGRLVLDACLTELLLSK